MQTKYVHEGRWNWFLYREDENDEWKIADKWKDNDDMDGNCTTE